MAKSTPSRTLWRVGAIRGILPFTLLLLLIEFFDELHYGVQSAALPALRADLGMSYAQVGLLLGLPVVISALIEPALMLLGDTRLRKPLIVGGGLTVTAATLALSVAGSFPLALATFIVAFPASGAFVTLSQATLMDQNRGREAQMMARWTAFGAAGSLLGPGLFALIYSFGLTWRNAYWLISAVGAALALLALQYRFERQHIPDSARSKKEGTIAGGVSHTAPSTHLANLPLAVLQALRTPRLLRWFFLLDFADLMGDVFVSFAALYFVDVGRLTTGQLGVLMSTLMAADLLANLALIPLLERVAGRRLLRISAWVTAGLYLAWLLVPTLWAKIALAVALRLTSTGWYEVLQGEAYAALPGRPGMVLAINSVIGLTGATLVWLLGQAAESFGLPAAMWLLLAGPLALIFFVPRAPAQ